MPGAEKIGSIQAKLRELSGPPGQSRIQTCISRHGSVASVAEPAYIIDRGVPIQVLRQVQGGMKLKLLTRRIGGQGVYGRYVAGCIQRHMHLDRAPARAQPPAAV